MKMVADSTQKAERQDIETKEIEKEKSEMQQGGRQCWELLKSVQTGQGKACRAEVGTECHLN